VQRLAGLAPILYALFLLYMLAAPLVELGGVVSGSVSLARYHLTYYGNPIRLPSLDAVQVLSLLLIAEAALLLSAGAYAVAGGNRRVAWELLVSALLVALAYAPLPLAMLQIVDSEVANLAVNHASHTSAGYVNLGATTLASNLLPAMKPAYIAATVAFLAAALALAYLTRPKEEQRGVGGCQEKGEVEGAPPA